MSEKIGYQHGITAFFDWYRKQPGVPQRGPNYDPSDIDTWPWPDKMERTLNILAADHDAAISNPPKPDPEPEPEPEPERRYAPMAYHSTGSADARFCCTAQYGCTRDGSGWVDAMGVRYDEAMRDLGGRSKRGADVMGFLKGANSMDGREPCEQYVGPTGETIGGAAGYPAKCFEQ